MGEPAQKIIQPQAGPQTTFMTTPADIAIYGGSAGGGKSFALLLEPLRHANNPKFNAITFRRQTTEIRMPGGLWDESYALYKPMGAHPRSSPLEWVWPSGAKFKFAHLEHEHTVYSYQGAQIPYIAFDELTHFSQKQFFYMMSRNRSTSGIAGYIRATCNPDPDSWVADFISWWINEDGSPNMERAGKLRWFIRRGDALFWENTREELLEKYGDNELPKSVTFIPSNIFDNKILMESDPSYLANLNALSLVDRGRLKDGNWKIRPAAGLMFRREWFPIVESIPGGWISCVRFWDRAATKPNENYKDPDWTRGLKMYRYPNDIYLVADLRSARDTPGKIEQMILNVAAQDSVGVRIVSQKDPGSAGVGEAENFVRRLSGYDVHVMTTSKDKITRAKPVSAQCEFGSIMVLKASWNDEFFTELENFPDGKHDDIVDTLSGAFNDLCTGISLFDVQK